MAKRQIGWALPAWVCVAAIVGGDVVPWAIAQVSEGLRPPSAFSDIADRAARSRALFAEVAKVITSPRCMNCHPAGDNPSQGDNEQFPSAGSVSRGSGRRRAWTALCRVSYGQELPAFSRGGKLPEHSWPPALGIGADRDGVAGQIAGSDLSPDKRSRPQRRTEPRSTTGAHGKG
jgi:hypothetical protein